MGHRDDFAAPLRPWRPSGSIVPAGADHGSMKTTNSHRPHCSRDAPGAMPPLTFSTSMCQVNTDTAQPDEPYPKPNPLQDTRKSPSAPPTPSWSSALQRRPPEAIPVSVAVSKSVAAAEAASAAVTESAPGHARDRATSGVPGLTLCRNDLPAPRRTTHNV